MTAFQLDDSANAPWRSTIAGVVDMGLPFLRVGGVENWDERGVVQLASRALRRTWMAWSMAPVVAAVSRSGLSIMKSWSVPL